MFKKTLSIALGAAMLAALSTPLTASAAGGDDSVTQRVNSALAADYGTQVKAESRNGTVYLQGSIHSEEMYDDIVLRASQASGAQSVNAGQLVLTPGS